MKKISHLFLKLLNVKTKFEISFKFLRISELYWDGSKSMPFPTKLYADESNFVYILDSIIITLSEKQPLITTKRHINFLT